MRRHLTGLVLLIASLLCARSVSAQDAGSVGVTMGYPGSVGVLWNVTEGVALRPELSFSHLSTDTETSPLGVVASNDGNTVSAGLSALFYVAKWDMLRIYLVPRYAY